MPMNTLFLSKKKTDLCSNYLLFGIESAPYTYNPCLLSTLSSHVEIDDQ